MGQPEPLSERERALIYQGKIQGKSCAQIATELQRSEAVVGKWMRRIREQGLLGLQARPRGPKRRGALSRFPKEVAQTVLELKRQHPGQGADHILSSMRAMERFPGQKLPSRSRIAAFFREQCPELIRKRHKKSPAQAAPSKATAAHEIWQLDIQEKIELADDSLASVCNIRDPFAGAMIASRAFPTKTENRWRKLTWPEIRQVLREAFTEWGTMPDCVQTDNELVLVGNPSDPFPSHLALWLAGLGIKHQTIRSHCATDQAEVERNHRTLNDATFGAESLANLPSFQAALDQERYLYNHLFPSRASDCQRQPPLTAHAELLQPRRPYSPENELSLFDLQRVFDYLATFTFERRVSASGTIGLEAHQCSIGRRHKGKLVKVRCDPVQHEWVIYETCQSGEQVEEKELLRRPIHSLNVQFLTGLDTSLPLIAMPIQLTLPFLV